MSCSTFVSRKLVRNSVQLASLLGIFSIAILAAEPLKTRSSEAVNQRLIATHASPSVPFQQTDVWALIKTDDGMLFVWNAHELHLTLGVKGKDIKRANESEHIFLAV